MGYGTAGDGTFRVCGRSERAAWVLSPASVSRPASSCPSPFTGAGRRAARALQDCVLCEGAGHLRLRRSPCAPNLAGIRALASALGPGRGHTRTGASVATRLSGGGPSETDGRHALVSLLGPDSASAVRTASSFYLAYAVAFIRPSRPPARGLRGRPFSSSGGGCVHGPLRRSRARLSIKTPRDAQLCGGPWCRGPLTIGLVLVGARRR